MRKKLILLFATIAVVALTGCNKDEPMTPIGSPIPYGIIDDVRFFTIDAGLTGLAWLTASDTWEQEMHGPFAPETMIEPPYRGCWTIYLDGPLYTLTDYTEKYERYALEWGIRIDNGEAESEVLKDVPFRTPKGNIIKGTIVTNHGISGMDLITESDFDAEHPAGTSLAAITHINPMSLEYQFKDEFDNQTYTDQVNLRIWMCDVDASTLDERIEDGIRIQITRNPEKAGEYWFRQIIRFTDGRVIQRRFKRIWLEEHMSLEYNEPHKPL